MAEPLYTSDLSDLSDLPASPTERAPSIALVTAAAALLGAVLQMCAAETWEDGADGADAEPVVKFEDLVRLGTRVSYTMAEMRRGARSDDEDDGEDQGGEEAGLSILAMRGGSTAEPETTDMRALLVVLAAYAGYEESPLFGCLASVVCRRLLLGIHNKDGKHYGLVSDAHRYMRGARGSSFGLRNPLNSIRAVVVAGGDSDVADRLVLDAKAMARLVREVVPHP